MKHIKQLIIILLTGTAFLITSCSENIEFPIDPETQAEAKVYDILLSSPQVDTRTKGDYDYYDYARPEELQVGRVVIATFKLDEAGFGEVIECREYNPSKTSVLVTGKEALAWSIEGISVTTHTRVLAIANTQIPIGIYKTYGSYDDFKKAVEQETTEFNPQLFKPESLVKAGQIDITGELPKENAIIVPMEQLAVRIDFNVKIELPEQEARPPYIEIPDTEIQDILNGIPKLNQPYVNKESGIYAEEIFASGPNKDRYGNDEIGYVYRKDLKYYHAIKEEWQEIPSSNDMKFAAVKGESFSVNNITTTRKYALEIKNNLIFVNNVQVSTDILLENRWNQQDPDLRSWSFELDADDPLITGSFHFSFYTYERKFTQNDDQLHIQIDAEIVEVEETVRAGYYAHAIGLWVNAPVKNPDGTWQAGSLDMDSGWGNGDGTKIFAPVATIPTSEPIPGKPVFTETSTQRIPVDIRVGLNPDTGLKHGNLYSKTVTIKTQETKSQRDDSIFYPVTTENIEIYDHVNLTISYW